MPASGSASSMATHDWREREGGVPMPNSLITDGNAGETAEWTPFPFGLLASHGKGLDGFIIDAIACFSSTGIYSSEEGSCVSAARTTSSSLCSSSETQRSA
eukprot:4059835-Prymnesium_polylepis.1